jgi:hypothetical protein
MKTKNCKNQNYYLFINSDGYGSDEKIVSAYEIAKYRIKHKIYPLFNRTLHIKELKDNDGFIFYVAGKKQNCKHFISYGKVESIEDKNKYNEEQLDIYKPFHKFAKLKSIKPIYNKNIIDLKKKLTFIPHTNKWGYVLQGGVIKISKLDFETIIKE